MATEPAAALAGLAAAQLDEGAVAEAAATLDRGGGLIKNVGEGGVRAGFLEQRARRAAAEEHLAEATALLAEASSVRDSSARPRTALEVRDLEELASRLAGFISASEHASP